MKLRRSIIPAALALLLISGAAKAAADPQDAFNRLIPTLGLKVDTDLSYGPAPRQKLDVYAPQKAQGAPTVLFIHGGSWTSGDKSGYRFVGESLARAGYVVGVMNYRLAPEYRYPAYVQDAAAALAWLRKHAATYGGSPHNLFIVGHSAGAFNAVALADDHGWLDAAGVPLSDVRGIVGIAGPYAYDYRSDPTRNAFAEGSDPAGVMPDRHVRRDAPPHLLLAAGNDTLVHPQNAVVMEQALRAAGVPVERRVLPGLNHVTIAAALARPLTWLGQTRAATLDFIEAHRR